MKKHFASFVFFLLTATAACALAAPKLTNVTAESDSLRAGGEWALTFETTEGGALAMSLRGADGESIELGATQVDAGSGRLIWDGILPDGSAAADGAYTVAVRLRNYWGEESEESLLPLTIGAPEAGEVRETADSDAPEALDLSGLDIQDALIWDEEIEEAQTWDEGQAAAEQTSAGGELLGHEPGRIRPDRPRPPEGHLGFDDAADYGDGRGADRACLPDLHPRRGQEAL